MSKINHYHINVRGREHTEHFFKVYMSLPNAKIKTQVISNEASIHICDYFIDIDEEDLVFLKLSCKIKYVINVDEFIKKRDEKINT